MKGYVWISMAEVNRLLRIASFCGKIGAGEEEHLSQIDFRAGYRARAVIIARLGNSRNVLSRGTESQA